jgi:molybdate transport system substrate-binding protein
MIFLRSFFALLVLIAYSPIAAKADDRPVVVFAAASLKTALDEIAAASSTKTSISYAGTPALAKQIQQGAPADIFISADLDWMNRLNDSKLIKRVSIVPLLGNQLVLVAPVSSPAAAEIKPGFDLVGLLAGGKLAMADVKSVPAGRYGLAALTSLGVWDKVAPSVVQSENVRAALKLVALREAALGIVYFSDAMAEKTVTVAGVFPENSHPKIIYPAGLLMTSENPNAQAFFDYLKSKEAAATFVKNGFTLLSGEGAAN